MNVFGITFELSDFLFKSVYAICQILKANDDTISLIDLHVDTDADKYFATFRVFGYDGFYRSETASADEEDGGGIYVTNTKIIYSNDD
ncbi:hypothetical protein D3P96_07775 [Weissella viridescens]|uniref:Uncharacterized protein n=1 Tax=Weissella viridescens TaxID=1629 RepID=A0A3P2RAG1_WEIVI|nr:hypothetical protein [Weissella viridescens]RRG17443.1 hypothetical protein D3P96_07775 [Weissella viridescens]